MSATPVCLNNVTIYVASSTFNELANFYTTLLGADILFDQPDHIRCLDLGPERSLCIHEEEPGHAAGEVEIIFWVDDLEEFRTAAEGYGVAPTLLAGGALQVTDPTGRLLRFQERPGD